MNAFTSAQLEAVMDAKERADLAGKKTAEIVTILTQEGHAAFASAASKPGAPPAPPKTPAGKAMAAAVDGLSTAISEIKAEAVAAAGSAPRGTTLPLPAPRALPGAAPATATAVLEPKVPAVPPAAQHAPRADAHLPAPRVTLLPAAPARLAIEGGESLDQSDIRIPRLFIQQKDEEGRVAGRWCLSVEEPEAGLEQRSMIFLEVTKGREWLLPYDNARLEEDVRQQVRQKYGVEVPADRNQVCRSPDRVAPEDVGYGVVSPAERGGCGKCPHAQWTTIGGKRAKPECGEYYRVLVLDLESFMPAFVRFRSSAIAAFKNALTLLQVGTARHPLFQGRGPAPFAAFKWTVGAKLVNVPGKTPHYVPVFGRPEPLTSEAEVQQGLDLRRAIIGNPHAVEDDGAAEADVDGAAA